MSNKNEWEGMYDRTDPRCEVLAQAGAQTIRNITASLRAKAGPELMRRVYEILIEDLPESEG